MDTESAGQRPNTVSFAEFAETMGRDSPLYGRFARAVAARPDIADLLDANPDPAQRIPVLLFAAVHDLVLSQPDLELAEWYPTVTTEPRTDDGAPTFISTCEMHRQHLSQTIATHQTQTNEVGRAAALMPALAIVSSELSEAPLSLVDVGASAGLNLGLDQFHYSYEPGGTLGPDASPVRLEAITQHFKSPAQLPPIAARYGLDRHPLDVGDPHQQRWLKACVWPDQTERFQRLDGAISIALANPPRLTTGDAINDIADLVAQAADEGHPTVMNSWVLSYFTTDDQRRFAERLDQIGREGDVSWVYFESPDWTPGLPWPDGELSMTNATYLMLATWRRGDFALRHLAVCHPHGSRIRWTL